MTTSPPRTRPLVIELVGPAGAGKTTLLRALRERRPALTDRLPLGNGQLLRCLLATTPLLTTTSLRYYRGGRWFSWGEIRSMLYLQGWQQRLPGLAAERPQTDALIFDHGPVYRLAWLSEFGPPMVRGDAYRVWWQDMLRRWATTLDWVIRLDAPTEVLIERIRSRSQEHLLKNASGRHVGRFLARYDTAYRRILDDMQTAGGGPRVLHVDSSRRPAGQLAAELLTAMQLR